MLKPFDPYDDNWEVQDVPNSEFYMLNVECQKLKQLKRIADVLEKASSAPGSTVDGMIGVYAITEKA